MHDSLWSWLIQTSKILSSANAAAALRTFHWLLKCLGLLLVGTCRYKASCSVNNPACQICLSLARNASHQHAFHGRHCQQCTTGRSPDTILATHLQPTLSSNRGGSSLCIARFFPQAVFYVRLSYFALVAQSLWTTFVQYGIFVLMIATLNGTVIL